MRRIEDRTLFTWDECHPIFVKAERLEARSARTLVIEGTIRVLDPPKQTPKGVRERTGFDHRGHLIAKRFGGPNRRLNLVAMHGLINQSGGPWYMMENNIAKLLGDRQGHMRVTIHYIGEDLRPFGFFVQVTTPWAQSWSMRNANPYLPDPRDPDGRRRAERDAAELSEALDRNDG